MEIETSLSADIGLARLKADYDAVCKRLLSEKSILAWILKSCASEFRGCPVEDIAERYIEGTPEVSGIPVEPSGVSAEPSGVSAELSGVSAEPSGIPTADTSPVIHGLPQEDASPAEGRVYFDIRFHALVPGTGEALRLIVNIEAQEKYDPGYPLLKRAVYYCGRMISAQKGTEFTKSEYGKLKKVYSIWICTDPPEDRANTITSYQLTERNLEGSVREDAGNYDLLSIVMVCLGDGQTGSGVLKLLGTLLSKQTAPEEKKRVLRDEFGIPMTETVDEEVSLMCNLSDGVLRRGIHIGEERGIHIGEERGIHIGDERSDIRNIQNLMNTSGWSMEKVMDMLTVPSEKRQAYAAQLRKQ